MNSDFHNPKYCLVSRCFQIDAQIEQAFKWLLCDFDILNSTEVRVKSPSGELE